MCIIFGCKPILFLLVMCIFYNFDRSFATSEGERVAENNDEGTGNDNVIEEDTVYNEKQLLNFIRTIDITDINKYRLLLGAVITYMQSALDSR